MGRAPGDWANINALQAHPYQCGYCGSQVASEKGWYINQHPNAYFIRVCPLCNRPSFFQQTTPGGFQMPGVAFGDTVGNLPRDLEDLYAEARRCTSSGANTAAVMACRKILMHIAVEKGDNFSFQALYDFPQNSEHKIPVAIVMGFIAGN